MKVLLIDDDALMVRMYQRTLLAAGYEYLVATNGEDGLRLAQTDHPDLILLDIMMPKLNGLEALDKLKTNPATASIPVVVISNLAGSKDADLALSKGAVKYLVKTEYEPKQVTAIIRELLGMKSS